MQERMGLEVVVGGTSFASVARSLFKCTKNNTKMPKEKHALCVHPACCASIVTMICAMSERDDDLHVQQNLPSLQTVMIS